MNNNIINYITKELISDQLDGELESSDDLLGSGLIDSLGMMRLVLFVENEYKLKIPPEDMTIENFMTVDHIMSYLEKQ
jgi:acyl carrier protein